MKKYFLLMAGITLGLFAAQNAQAVDISNNATNGGPVSISVTAGNPTFDDFNPSTNVIMAGSSEATGFAIGGYHIQVDQKKSGKQFAMAADSSAIWYRDISDTAAAAVNQTNSNGGVFDGTNTYTKM